MRIITGKYGRRRFDVPNNITARPTTDMARENLFNVLMGLIDLEEKTVLDLFAGTGAISFEFLSRGCAHVTAVEKARTQCEFIKRVQTQLGDPNLTLVRDDVFKFIANCRQSFDVIFADPPYDLPRFADVPRLVLDSPLVHDGTLFIMEHPREHDFTALPHFLQQRVYGKVNFSLFEIHPPAQD
ncbi:MAG: 16S rRNA (guanine(966)-N(2))-methyltransferase RsmD [Muribaculaceae bacterium]|nr:16S rRNA (guanine(966)-N(2))-methyltransferase RsmD [Muribaculaceae bacterium]